MDKSIGMKEKYLKRIKEFCLFDDSFFNIVLDGNIECVELILRIILNREDIKVLSVHTQHEVRNIGGHSVRFDVAAVGADGERLDIEIQRADKGASAKRARFHSSIMDVDALDKGSDYEELPESYVIFITENDVMGADLPVYHADRIVAETGNVFEDGSHIIYVNGAYKNTDDPVGKLMHDFKSKSAEEMYYKPLAEQVKHYKESEKGELRMCRIIEELVEEEKKEVVQKMLIDGVVSVEKIAEYLGLSLETVRKISEEMKAMV